MIGLKVRELFTYSWTRGMWISHRSIYKNIRTHQKPFQRGKNEGDLKISPWKMFCHCPEEVGVGEVKNATDRTKTPSS